MRYPLNAHRKDIVDAEGAREREKELAKGIQEGEIDEDDALGGGFRGPCIAMRVVFSCFEHKCCGKQLRGRRFEDELSRESSIAVELGKQRAVNYIYKTASSATTVRCCQPHELERGVRAEQLARIESDCRYNFHYRVVSDLLLSGSKFHSDLPQSCSDVQCVQCSTEGDAYSPSQERHSDKRLPSLYVYFCISFAPHLAQRWRYHSEDSTHWSVSGGRLGCEPRQNGSHLQVYG